LTDDGWHVVHAHWSLVKEQWRPKFIQQCIRNTCLKFWWYIALERNLVFSLWQRSQVISFKGVP